MADVAELGLRVKSEGVDRAIAEMRQLEQIGRRAGGMADALSNQTQGATRQIAEMERAASRTGQALGRMISVGISGAITAFGYGLVRAKNQIIELAKVAEDNRLRPEMVSGLFGAAGSAGATTREITKALSHFSDVSKQTRDDAETFFKAMTNISPALAKAFESAPTQEERLRLISEALKNTSDETKRLQLAQEAFGTDSERILRVLGAGREALSEYERAARAMGLAVDQEMIAKAKQADQALAQLSNVISANLRAALVDLAPVIANVAAQLGPLANAASAIISNLLNAQGLATTSVLRQRQAGGDREIAELEGHAERLSASRRLADVQEVDRINAEIARIRRRNRDVEAELSNRGEFADPRDLRSQASERFRLSGGLAGAPRAFAARPDLSSSGGGSNSDSESSFDRALRQLQEQTKLQEASLQSLGQETAERERIVALQRAMNVAARDGEELTADQKKQIKEAAAAYGRMAAAIEKAKQMQRQLVELNTFARDTVKGFLSDFTSSLAQGENAFKAFGDAALRALQRIADKLIEMALQNLWTSAFGGGGGLLSMIFGGLGGGGTAGVHEMSHAFAKGGAFSGGNVIPFASGGVVSRPTLFPMANGAGLMGEAGPEGILPLRRNQRGQLGVMAQGGGGMSVVFSPVTNITIQGGADNDTLATLKAELDKRDQRLRQEMPAVIARARRDGIAA